MIGSNGLTHRLSTQTESGFLMASHFAPQGSSRPEGGAPRSSAHMASHARPQQQMRKAESYTVSDDSAFFYQKPERHGHGGGGGPRRRHTGRIVAIVVGVVLVALLAVGGVAGFTLYRSAMTVKDNASALMAQAGTLEDSLMSGDSAALSAAVEEISAKADAINEEVHTPLWNVAALIPVVGEDVRSAQTLGSTAVRLVDDALVPVTQGLSGMSLSSLVQDGAVNVDLLRTISASLTDALPVIEESVDTISSLPDAHIPQLREVLGKVQEPISGLRGAISQVKPVLDILPQMLGADGQTRTYLIIAQNNAELRSTGGLPGSWGTVSVTDGVISMGDDFQTILHGSGLRASATDEEIYYVCSTIHTDPAQMNFTPDFTRVGLFAKEYWEQSGNGSVDGVIAIDPVFLQRLLGLTGGFAASDGTTVDGTNAAKVLLSDTYWKFGNDGEAQDEYFSSVASLAFDHVMQNLGNVDLLDLGEVIGKSAEDGRLYAWMANEDEQGLVTDMGFSGALSQDPTAPQLGVYLNDDTISKISWYASVKTTIGEGVRNSDGTTTYDVVTTLSNTISPEEASSAPEYISGGNSNKRDVSDMLDYVYFYAPAGGSISNFTVSDGALMGDPIDHPVYGLQVINAHVHARSGETVTFTYQVTVSAEATEPLTLRTTPLAQENLM